MLFCNGEYFENNILVDFFLFTFKSKGTVSYIAAMDGLVHYSIYKNTILVPPVCLRR